MHPGRQRWTAWVAAYEQAWRTPGTESLEALFTPEATYRTAPFQAPYRGLVAIGQMWADGRLDAGEAFTLEAEPVAIEPPTGVLRIEVRYGPPRERHYRDLWVVTLADDGRCAGFEEWPFWPPGSGGTHAPGPGG